VTKRLSIRWLSRKTLIIAAITSPNKQISLFGDHAKAAEQIAQMYKTIYAVVSK